jgi:hypothetical protein
MAVAVESSQLGAAELWFNGHAPAVAAARALKSFNADYRDSELEGRNLLKTGAADGHI